ncbi:MAG: hypothetical protein LBS81_04730 [Endomicrobium sp.]|jgi:hypothetical protein|nr:hypothetical protein [Endomicrobium sp.]
MTSSTVNINSNAVRCRNDNCNCSLSQGGDLSVFGVKTVGVNGSNVTVKNGSVNMIIKDNSVVNISNNKVARKDNFDYSSREDDIFICGALSCRCR